MNIQTDNLEAIHQRLFAVQKEMGEVKNATLFQSVAHLTGSKEDKLALGRMIHAQGGVNKLLEKEDK